jgi:GNAT superfamily N-acetyltransferase
MLTLLRKWFESEWGDVDPFEGIYPEIVIPRPIVAVDHQASLLGGLAFTSAFKPQSTDIGVWINMVLISPRQRKKGIASKLIEVAEVEAKRIAISELFVLSEFPNLYKRLGWQSVGLDRSGKETVLKIVPGNLKSG